MSLAGLESEAIRQLHRAKQHGSAFLRSSNIVLCLLVYISTPLAIAAEQPAGTALYQPSVFRADKFSLAHQISFPQSYKEGQDFSLAIACTTHVTREGRLKFPYCLGGNDETRQFERLILLATERAKMKPARVNGRRKPVVVKFTTVFSRTDGAASITVVPNHLLNVDELGVSYTAPQLLTRDSRGYPLTCRGMNVIMKITVDELGAATDARLHLGDSSAEGCIRPITERISRLRYIPGTVNGIPTRMEHLYLVSWRGGWAIT